MKQETGVLQSDLKEMLDNDYKIIVDCRDMFDSIKAHIFLADKGGASLSTVRLEQLVNVVGENLEHCKEIQMDKEVRGGKCSTRLI